MELKDIWITYLSIKSKDWAMIIMMPLTTGTSVFKDHNT